MRFIHPLPPPPWNNLNRLSTGYSYLKNKFGHDIEDCIEMVLKQPISSFNAALASPKANPLQQNHQYRQRDSDRK